jgi:hypothetical protein
MLQRARHRPLVTALRGDRLFERAHSPRDFLPVARPAGVLCEKAMSQAMGGVHTDAIFLARPALFCRGPFACQEHRVGVTWFLAQFPTLHEGMPVVPRSGILKNPGTSVTVVRTPSPPFRSFDRHDALATGWQRELKRVAPLS